jgi:hypothetical protein
MKFGPSPPKVLKGVLPAGRFIPGFSFLVLYLLLVRHFVPGSRSWILCLLLMGRFVPGSSFLDPHSWRSRLAAADTFLYWLRVAGYKLLVRVAGRSV